MGRHAYRKSIHFYWLGIQPRSRFSYWSHSKLAKYLKKISGVDSPEALTLDGWDEYYDSYRSKAPLTFFFNENVLPSLQNIVSLPGDIWHTFHVYYSNAIQNKVHYLDTGLPRGKWYDTDTRILCASMNALVDFVEKEWAWLYVICHEEKNDLRADFHHFNRSPRAAELYIKKELDAEFDPSDYGVFDSYDENGEETVYYKEAKKQFERNKKYVRDVYDIYTWWKKYFKEVMIEYTRDYDDAIERKYLIKLIRVRKGLWT